MKELCYKISALPDLTLNKYSFLDGSGVDGVLEKHLSFLRQWNRKGALSGLSIHLLYYYDNTSEKGNRLEILFLVRGPEDKLKNVPEMVRSSPLSGFFPFQGTCKLENKNKEEYSFEMFLQERNIKDPKFSVCSTLIKKEVFIKPAMIDSREDEGYYTVPKWEMNEEGRLFNMSKLMEALNKTILYRVDLYPVERSEALREALRKPVSVLRERQFARAGREGQRDYEADNVLRSYEDLLEGVDLSPHFITNVFVFGNDVEDSVVVLDSAGAEALKKGNYCIATYSDPKSCMFTPKSFLESSDAMIDFYVGGSRVILQKSPLGIIACKEDAQNFKLRYLPTLFTLEEAAPFFRFPALYDGEVIEKRKETAPKTVDKELLLGTDENGYEVYFPLKNLEKHAFISGVPGSGKTHTMRHIISTLWKTYQIPFLVLEPAKQEYRALANQKGMEAVHIFAPNADMSFPLHINPFEFPKGLMVAEHIRRLVGVFEGAFPLDNPMPFLLDTAIEAVYRQTGWSPEMVYTDETTLKFPTMSMLYRRLEEELKTTTYSDEIRGNLESALKVRIGSLLRREMGDVFDVPFSTVAPEDWLKISAVIELESMGAGPANFLTLILCALIRESLKVRPHHDKGYARHIIFIEEAHNLIGPESEEVYGNEANPKQAATSFIVKMLAEVRALKEGIVIADQLPTVMAPEVIKNTGLKIGHKITSSDDRSLLCSTMAASGMQMEEMVTFGTGEALISYEGLMRPFKIRIHEWCGEIEDKKERDIMTTPKTDSELKEMLSGRETYRNDCAKSFIIESTRFSQEYKRLSEKADKIIDHIRTVNEKDVKIRKDEESYKAMLHSLVSQPNWEENKDETIKLANMNDLINAQKIELKNKYKSSPYFKMLSPAISECIALAQKIEDRKKHWIRLGIRDIESMGAQSRPRSKVQENAFGINEIQKRLILTAQRMYAIGIMHLKDQNKTLGEIESAISKFEVNNIMGGLGNG